MCLELPPGCCAAGHLLSNCIIPGLGLDDGTLWRPGMGGALSCQKPSQQKMGLDEMVRRVFVFLFPNLFVWHISYNESSVCFIQNKYEANNINKHMFAYMFQ